MPDKFKIVVFQQMVDIVFGAGETVVDTDDFIPAFDESITKMGAEKAASTGDDNAFFQMHGMTSLVLSVTSFVDRFIAGLSEFIKDGLKRVCDRYGIKGR